ncbi:hypothetical protein FXO38_01861 [Capsicum annuum]|nr:hypothetical protein FXO38_01861 [Capsicum annuum]
MGPLHQMKLQQKIRGVLKLLREVRLLVLGLQNHVSAFEVGYDITFFRLGHYIMWDILNELVDDLAMQVTSYPQVQYLFPEDILEEIVNKEREIKIQKEDLLSKPEQIRSKIFDGWINKRLEEMEFLEQPYIKNDKMVVKNLVKQTTATIGENIKVKRFVRYNSGKVLKRRDKTLQQR